MKIIVPKKSSPATGQTMPAAFLNVSGLRTLIFFALLAVSVAVKAQGPGSGWNYARTINLSVPTTLANYQVRVTLTTAAMGNPYSYVNTDGSDLRFYDNANNLCSYWIESFDRTGTSVIWVKVPSTGSYITMFYGNSAASAVTNGAATFDYFEDFTAAMGATWSTITTGGTVIQNTAGAGTVTLTNTNAGTVSLSNISPFTTASTAFFLETKHREVGYNRNRFYATNLSHGSSVTGFDYGYFASTGTAQTVAKVFWNGFSATDVVANNTDYLTRWQISDGTTHNWSTLRMSDYGVIDNRTATATAQIRYFAVKCTEKAATSAIVDWVRVRKSQATDPVTSIGGETVYPLNPTITDINGATRACVNATVTINGTNLAHAYSITIGGTSATILTNTATVITATTGNGTTGNIIIKTAIGTSAGYPFTIDQLPATPISNGANAICIGQQTPAFTNATAGGTWSTSNPALATINSSGILTGVAAGNVNVLYTVTHAGCTGQFSKAITINALPTVNAIGGAATVCAGSQLTLTNTTTGGTWSVTNGTGTASISNTGILTGLTAGSVTVNYTYSNGNCAGTVSKAITVNPAPVVTVVANYCDYPGVVRIIASSNSSSNDWSWSTGDVGTGESSYINVNVAGNYEATATANGCSSSATMSIAQELVTNGDFEQGNVGFTTDYAYKADLPGVNNELVPDGGNDGYGVGKNGQHYHGGFWGVDHTTADGTGNFMLVNGHGSLIVWKNSNVTVLPNTKYYFSGWAMSLNAAGNNAKLRFEVNGVQVGSTANLTNGVNNNSNSGWIKFYGDWTSGAGVTSANINIINLEPAASGNDFGLDDISFGTLSTFFTINSDPITNNQTSVCEGTPIQEIVYEVGGDGNSPTIIDGALPPGVSTYWNGRNYRVSGAPTAVGSYSFTIRSSGCNAKNQVVNITVIPKSKAGTIAGGHTMITDCYNASGTIAHTGNVGTLAWQTSANGIDNWQPATGNNYSSLQSAIYYRAIAQNTAACPRDTSAIVKLAVKNLWTGDVDADWNTAGNWSNGSLPEMVTCDNVVVPVLSGKPYPVYSNGTYAIKNLLVNTGASLTISNDAILKISGSITSPAAAINATNGAIEMNGTADQSLSGSWFNGRNIKKLIVSGNTLNISAVAGDTLNILEKLSFENSTTADLNTNDNITLKSQNAGTASVGVLAPGNIITGKFGIERFIKYWQNWDLISAPLRDASISIKNSWQEGGLPVSPLTSTGFGMQVTAAGGANGLDASSASPNMKWWNAAPGQGWQNITNTNTTPVNNKNGFYAYIRGDRGYGPTTPLSSGSTTTLRAKGTIYDANHPAPAVTVNATTVNGYMIQVGNPLASAVDFSSVYAHSTGIKPVYQVWDPSRNGGYGAGIYQAFTSVTGWRPTPSGGGLYATGVQNTAIQSGQAFFVEASVTTGSAINFVENDKMDGSRTVTRNPADDVVMMSTMLHGLNGDVADGNRVAYNSLYSNGIGDEDANKIAGSAENFSVISSAKLLIVEGRQPIISADTIFYNMTNLRTQAYKLSFEPMNLEDPTLSAELVDRFTNTRTPVSLTDSTYYDFSTTTAAASKAANRFILVFKRTAVVVLPVNFVSVSARREADRSIAINWSVANEINIIRYEVERSANGTNFTGILTQNTTGRSNYNQVDLSPLAADNFYRIKAIGLGNELIYSSIVKVAPLAANANMAVYPNPVIGNQMNVVFTGQAKGSYSLQLSNLKGQLVYNETVQVNAENFSRQITLNPGTAAGSYQLKITAPDGSFKTIRVLIQ